MREHIVIKVGGASLFSEGEFRCELNSVLDVFQNSKVYLMVGGGDLIESMRTLCRIYPTLDSARMHWRCVSLLDHTCEIVGELFPSIPLIRTEQELDNFRRDTGASCAWILVRTFYEQTRVAGLQPSWLPNENWDTTSDALAWLLAMTVRATRVVLLKRGLAHFDSNLEHAAADGIIDRELARLVHLHEHESPVVELRGFGEKR